LQRNEESAQGINLPALPGESKRRLSTNFVPVVSLELELELIQTQMAQKPMLREEVGMRVRCANKASAE